VVLSGGSGGERLASKNLFGGLILCVGTSPSLQSEFVKKGGEKWGGGESVWGAVGGEGGGGGGEREGRGEGFGGWGGRVGGVESSS